MKNYVFPFIFVFLVSVDLGSSAILVRRDTAYSTNFSSTRPGAGMCFFHKTNVMVKRWISKT